MNLFDLLPNELFLEIFQFISPINLLKNCCLVNRQWNDNIKFMSDDYWKYYYQKECFKFYKLISPKMASSFFSLDYDNNSFIHLASEINNDQICEIIKKSKVMKIFKKAYLVEFIEIIFFDQYFEFNNSNKDLFKKIKDLVHIQFGYQDASYYCYTMVNISSNINSDYLLNTMNLASKIKYEVLNTRKNFNLIELRGSNIEPEFIQLNKLNGKIINIKKYNVCYFKKIEYL